MPSGNPDNPTKPDSKAYDEASAWFAKLQSGQITLSQQAAFEQWLAASELHRLAYEQATKLWQSPALDVALSRYAVIPAKPKVGCSRQWLAVACILLTFGLGIQALGLQNLWRADYVTATGEQRSITLADGSSVTLNTDSAIQINYRQGERGIILLQGEAYFNITPDKTKPFVVNAKQDTIRVVGTQFSVRTGETTQVAVESGLVICANQRGDKTTLSPGQQTLIDEKQASPALALDDPQTFAWTNGRLVFKNRRLSEVMAELDRYQPGSIVVANSNLGQTRISGNYKLQDIPFLINTIADITHAKVISISPYLTVLR